MVCRGIIRVLKTEDRTWTAGSILAGTRYVLPCCLYITKACLTHFQNTHIIQHSNALFWCDALVTNPAILLLNSEGRGQVIGTAPLPNMSNFLISITSSWRMVAYSMQIHMVSAISICVISQVTSIFTWNFWCALAWDEHVIWCEVCWGRTLDSPEPERCIGAVVSVCWWAPIGCVCHRFRWLPFLIHNFWIDAKLRLHPCHPGHLQLQIAVA